MLSAQESIRAKLKHISQRSAKIETNQDSLSNGEWSGKQLYATGFFLFFILCCIFVVLVLCIHFLILLEKMSKSKKMQHNLKYYYNSRFKPNDIIHLLCVVSFVNDTQGGIVAWHNFDLFYFFFFGNTTYTIKQTTNQSIDSRQQKTKSKNYIISYILFCFSLLLVLFCLLCLFVCLFVFDCNITTFYQIPQLCF